MIKKVIFVIFGVILSVVALGLLLRFRNLPSLLLKPQESKQTIFEGVTYQQEVRTEPRRMVIHVVTVDLKANGIKVLVTPGDKGEELPLTARTTSEFLEDYELQLAINGDAFHPWFVFWPFYGPHSGDDVDVFGFAASKGEVYSEERPGLPTLYVYTNNKASINAQIGKMYNAVSGTRLLIQRAEMLANLGDNVQPRTAVGLDRSGRHLIIVVVDGRQPLYSEGATLQDVAQILLDHGAYTGFNLDGGGSSTLVMEGIDGNVIRLNSPIHLGIQGNERPVGNHLGIYAKKIEK